MDIASVVRIGLARFIHPEPPDGAIQRIPVGHKSRHSRAIVSNFHGIPWVHGVGANVRSCFAWTLIQRETSLHQRIRATAVLLRPKHMLPVTMAAVLDLSAGFPRREQSFPSTGGAGLPG